MTSHDFARILADTRIIAVLGAHTDRSRPAYYVPEHMHAHGYRVLGVNPMLAGTLWFGEPIRATLAELTEPVDLVDVFRNPDHLEAHLPDILAMQPAPKVVWMQLGVRHAAVAHALREAGIEVVEDRCLLVEHRRHGSA